MTRGRYEARGQSRVGISSSFGHYGVHGVICDYDVGAAGGSLERVEGVDVHIEAIGSFVLPHFAVALIGTNEIPMLRIFLLSFLAHRVWFFWRRLALLLCFLTAGQPFGFTGRRSLRLFCY